MTPEGKESAYPPGIEWVEHSDSRHPKVPAFEAACDLCNPPESWDGIPEGWLEEDDNDA